MKTATEFFAGLANHHLVALASVPADPAFCPAPLRSLVLIGPAGGSTWWAHVTASAEWQDQTPDPIDRWSKRVLSALAEDSAGRALFPSDGPPYPPFFRWAQDSGALWQSPVGMLVHAEAGLWVSFRGALALPFDVTLPQAENPCIRCADRPCVTACPVGALTPTVYDVPTCHSYLDTNAGKDCLSSGCLARRACPVSQSHARLAAQSEYHMSRFHI